MKERTIVVFNCLFHLTRIHCLSDRLRPCVILPLVTLLSLYRFLFSGYSGCNDAFSVFGFLAFLLALFDLIMELQNDMNMARSVRDVSAREGPADHLLPVSGSQVTCTYYVASSEWYGNQ